MKPKRKKLPYNDKCSLYENFLRYIADGKKDIYEVIQYISFLNMKCAAMVNAAGNDVSKLPDEDKDNILDFYENFMEEFDALTKSERFEEWGSDDVYILRIGYMLFEAEYISQRDEFIDSLSEDEIKECNEFADAVLKIKGEKNLSYSCDGYDGQTMTLENYAPGQDSLKNMKDKDVQQYRKDLLYGIGNMMDGVGGIVIREFTDNGANIYGVRVLDGKWEPISQKEMFDAHTLSPSGYRIAPEKGVTYCELPKRPGSIKPLKPGKTASKPDRSIFRVVK